MKKPLVSIIITTKNEEKNIKNCLQSIKMQTYKNIEIIVVDNNSSDKTKDIAKKYTKHVLNIGPERSAQRNFGAQKAKGEYVLFLDADMVLSKKVVEECLEIIEREKVGGIVIPEESYGIGFWAKCKSFERSFYLGNEYIEAARFYNKKIFKEIGGFDLNLTGPEDWDLSQRVAKSKRIERIENFIYHNEGDLSLSRTLKKKYYYAKKLKEYMKKQGNKNSSSKQMSVISRYKVFFERPTRLISHPILSVGMLFMKTCEFAAVGIGYLVSL